jgi:hypothetical protein
MNFKRHSMGVFALGAALVLGGCGGGGDGGSNNAGNGTGGDASSSIPSSATASIEAFAAYMKVQVAGISETSSPILLGNAIAPTSDTATPVGL